jgi:hypothetical protein
MMRRLPRRKKVIENITWFSFSLLLSFIVWVTASLASNPVSERRMASRVAIELQLAPNVIVTNNPTNTAAVRVRAPASTFEQLAADDVRVIADLSDITTSGRVTVPLEGVISEKRQASIAGVSPSQITVELQLRQEQLIPLELTTVGEVPATIERGTPSSNITQVLVAGPADVVSGVVSARVVVDLEGQRESFEQDFRPQLFDVNGNAVTGLTVTPEEVGVNVEMQPRSDVREVRVRPDIIGEPPEGYTLSADFSYEPETLFVTGPQEALEALPGTLSTQSIDLSTNTNDFQIRVPVEIPDNRVVPITGQLVTVRISIDPIQSSSQFESIPVEVIGLADGFEVVTTPTEVTVIVNGAQFALDDLTVDNIRVLVDAGGRTEAGTFQLEPTVAVTVADIESAGISTIPTTIDVQLAPINAATPNSP